MKVKGKREEDGKHEDDWDRKGEGAEAVNIKQ